MVPLLLRLWALLTLLVGLWIGVPSYAFAAANTATWLDTPAPGGEFRQAIAPYPWHFPEDFGPHNDYQNEWWYYTGTLETAEGKPFGFQLTFFRRALVPTSLIPASVGELPLSHWRTNQIYSAHFTVTDVEDGKFYPYERFSRNVLDLAGAEASPYHVWLNDWSATELAPGTVRLQATEEDVAIDLTVTQTRPPVLQGDRGLSKRGPEPGNASYYYSLVQQPTTGTITVKGQTFAVQGVTWKDHEYATKALTPGTVGWDWFSMQFNDGSALMLYLLRHEDGTNETSSSGTFISPTGDTTTLSQNAWTLRVLDTWKSPRSGATYPARWALQIPQLDLSLEGRSLLPDQELNTATATYWEGATAFAGSRGDRSIQGKGYVELTGYATRLDALLAADAP